MGWERQRSLERIQRFRTNVPETEIQVEDFAQDYLPRRRRELLAKSILTEAAARAVVNIPRNRAILTNGVHVYADLMDFPDQLASERETIAAYRRALQFLHLHYGGCDRLIEVFGLQRVDFHGSRLHAVVLTPEGPEAEPERIARGVAFARAFIVMVERASVRFNQRFRTRVSVGIDSGPAIAINSGRGNEHEPLFIGRPANRAAHLAACGEPGVHLSEHAREVLTRERWARERLASPTPQCLIEEAARRGSAAPARLSSRSLGEDAQFEIADFERDLAQLEHAGAPAVFHFHHHQPPLRTIVFEDLPPSNSVLMEMATVFADLAGFTNYVDRSLSSGAARQVVANLHVLRGEMAATVRADFNGRKVRFIGDCIQAVLAEGDNRAVDPKETVEQAILTAGGLRSSFDLCREALPGIADLGLAIGIEHGPTPACRIGLRGEASVRCVTSAATCGSEAVQQACGDLETGLGEEAFRRGGLRVQQAFRESRRVRNLNYTAALSHIRGLPHTRVGTSAAPAVRAHSG